MMALLKQKAKVGVATKPRRTFDIADVFMRVKQADGSIKQVQHEERGPDE